MTDSSPTLFQSYPGHFPTTRGWSLVPSLEREWLDGKWGGICGMRLPMRRGDPNDEDTLPSPKVPGKKNDEKLNAELNCNGRWPRPDAEVR